MKKFNLKAYRKKLKMTQKELSEKLGVNTNTVARWERGEMKFPNYLEMAIRQLYIEF